ncbi:hypothetical protein PoMZ_02710 [Pyricularia oryzae]|uniref:Uncharacterized protein n=1 Tax=Pyricularia oryzae TaxID=318829 RepID=A0A4V1C5W2_PYROR|nr:hypothetical protein PoMZ_02710 [Pyricularia oryzae]
MLQEKHQTFLNGLGRFASKGRLKDLLVICGHRETQNLSTFLDAADVFIPAVGTQVRRRLVEQAPQQMPELCVLHEARERLERDAVLDHASLQVRVSREVADHAPLAPQHGRGHIKPLLARRRGRGAVPPHGVQEPDEVARRVRVGVPADRRQGKGVVGQVLDNVGRHDAVRTSQLQPVPGRRQRAAHVDDEQALDLVAGGGQLARHLVGEDPAAREAAERERPDGLVLEERVDHEAGHVLDANLGGQLFWAPQVGRIDAVEVGREFVPYQVDVGRYGTKPVGHQVQPTRGGLGAVVAWLCGFSLRFFNWTGLHCLPVPRIDEVSRLAASLWAEDTGRFVIAAIAAALTWSRALCVWTGTKQGPQMVDGEAFEKYARSQVVPGLGHDARSDLDGHDGVYAKVGEVLVRLCHDGGTHLAKTHVEAGEDHVAGGIKDKDITVGLLAARGAQARIRRVFPTGLQGSKLLDATDAVHDGDGRRRPARTAVDQEPGEVDQRLAPVRRRDEAGVAWSLGQHDAGRGVPKVLRHVRLRHGLEALVVILKGARQQRVKEVRLHPVPAPTLGALADGVDPGLDVVRVAFPAGSDSHWVLPSDGACAQADLACSRRGPDGGRLERHGHDAGFLNRGFDQQLAVRAHKALGQGADEIHVDDGKAQTLVLAALVVVTEQVGCCGQSRVAIHRARADGHALDPMTVDDLLQSRMGQPGAQSHMRWGLFVQVLGTCVMHHLRLLARGLVKRNLWRRLFLGPTDPVIFKIPRIQRQCNQEIVVTLARCIQSQPVDLDAVCVHVSQATGDRTPARRLLVVVQRRQDEGGRPPRDGEDGADQRRTDGSGTHLEPDGLSQIIGVDGHLVRGLDDGREHRRGYRQLGRRKGHGRREPFKVGGYGIHLGRVVAKVYGEPLGPDALLAKGFLSGEEVCRGAAHDDGAMEHDESKPPRRLCKNAPTASAEAETASMPQAPGSHTAASRLARFPTRWSTSARESTPATWRAAYSPSEWPTTTEGSTPAWRQKAARASSSVTRARCFFTVLSTPLLSCFPPAPSDSIMSENEGKPWFAHRCTQRSTVSRNTGLVW